METKKGSAAAVAALCALLVVMMSGQAAAKSQFCACYEGCYPACRNNVPRFFCVPFCANKCSPREATGAAGAGDPCWAACAAVKICGLSDPPADAADAATCAKNCNKRRSRT